MRFGQAAILRRRGSLGASGGLKLIDDPLAKVKAAVEPVG
jgi:hypothetical protein